MKFYQLPISSWLLGVVPGAVSRLPVSEKTLYLTFDDGPHPETTPSLIEMLGQYEATATHFLLGKRVEDWTEGISMLVESGQQIANHGWDHSDPWRVGPQAELAAARRTAQLLRQQTNQHHLWYRPPYGHLHPFAARRLNQQFKVALWSIMPGDFDKEVSAPELVCLTLQQAAPGKILVLHDSPQAWPTLQKALPDLFKQLSARGYTLRHLP